VDKGVAPLVFKGSAVSSNKFFSAQNANGVARGPAMSNRGLWKEELCSDTACGIFFERGDTRRKREENMNTRSLILASLLAAGLGTPAMAEERYLAFFKYSDTAVKAMAENPQDQSAQIAKLAESFGGELEAAYWFPAGSEYDGMVIQTFPDEVTAKGHDLFVRATGNIASTRSIPLMDAEEFKQAMEKAKSVKSSYTPPTETKE
jgi:uncharacterized protein with GYD domain